MFYSSSFTLKLQYNESAAHRVKPQSVTVGDIGAVLSAVQNYKNETRAKFVDGHGESRLLLTISGGLLSPHFLSDLMITSFLIFPHDHLISYLSS